MELLIALAGLSNKGAPQWCVCVRDIDLARGSIGVIRVLSLTPAVVKPYT